MKSRLEIIVDRWLEKYWPVIESNILSKSQVREMASGDLKFNVLLHWLDDSAKRLDKRWPRTYRPTHKSRIHVHLLLDEYKRKLEKQNVRSV